MKKISRENLIEDVLKVYRNSKRDNCSFSRNYYIKNGKYSRKPIDRLFGSWNNMLKELNLPLNQEVLLNNNNYAYTDKQLLNDLKKIYEEYGACSAKLIKHNATACVEVYQRRFGCINNAMKKIGIPTTKPGESREAKIIFEQISKILKTKFEYEKTFDWLINPRTNRHLYIDAYSEDLKLAIEYNGKQHYQICPQRFPGDCEEQLKIRQERDQIKEKLIKEHNIKFLTIKYTFKNNRIELIKLLSTIL